MDRIRLDRFGEILADCPGRGLRGVRRSHDLTVERHRIVTLEDLNDDRTGAHKGNEIPVEWSLRMYLIETLGLRLRQSDTLLSDDAQPALFKAIVDRASQASSRRIRFDNRQGAFDGHPLLSTRKRG